MPLLAPHACPIRPFPPPNKNNKMEDLSSIKSVILTICPGKGGLMQQDVSLDFSSCNKAKAKNTGGPHIWWDGSKCIVGRPAVGVGGRAPAAGRLDGSGRPPKTPPFTAGRPTIYLDPAHHICGPPVFPTFGPYCIFGFCVILYFWLLLYLRLLAHIVFSAFALHCIVFPGQPGQTFHVFPASLYG